MEPRGGAQADRRAVRRLAGTRRHLVHQQVVLLGELLARADAALSGPYLASRRAEFGRRVERVIVVGDDEEHIASAVDALGARCGLIFVSGGLGPTLRALGGVGAAGQATIRTTLLPIETTKVLMQVDAEEFPALLPSLPDAGAYARFSFLCDDSVASFVSDVVATSGDPDLYVTAPAAASLSIMSHS